MAQNKSSGDKADVTLAAKNGDSATGDGSDGGSHTAMARAIRALAMDGVETAKSGHPGMPMGAADVATVLFTRHLKFDPTELNWPDRDRFVLSAGHGSMLLYACLHLLGYDDMPIEALKKFRQIGSNTPGHPEFGHGGGIETTTGPLGQGLATAVGLAMAERHMAARYGADIVDHHTYCLAGDGCLMEGISHEAISLAGHLKLDRLIVLFDDNDISIDGPLCLTESGDQIARFDAANWHTQSIDGHDPEAISAAIDAAKASDRPSMIACKTVIGFGAPTKAGTSSVHGSPLGAEEYAAARKALGIDYPPFVVPAPVRDAWRLAGLRGVKVRKAWAKRLEAMEPEVQDGFSRALRRHLPAEFDTAMASYKASLLADPPAVASRKASEMALEVINASLTQTLGGSADLTGSNNTRTKDLELFDAENYAGRYVHYGVREHAMAAAMNGLALHGGVIPYGGTFLVFSDYCRPAIRLSALMGLRVIYVFTHDSIGLGEDGPTHQPVEHLAALRAIPGLHVFRPADAVETAEAWELALKRETGPCVLALSRQTLTPVRDQNTDPEPDNRSVKGAYELVSGGDEAAVSIFASGSEVEIAITACAALQRDGIAVRVVSVPCTDLFFEQSKGFREQIIGQPAVKIAIEAGIRQGWDAIIGPDGDFVGMSGFGASAPGHDVYAHFNITAQAVVDAVKARLG